MDNVIYLAPGATEADIQNALNKLPDGGKLVLPKDQTILITKGLVMAAQNGKDLSIDLNGSTLQQAADVMVLWAKGSHAAIQNASLGEDAQGHVTVSMANASKIAVGDWVKVVSDDALPGDHLDSGVPTRLGQAMQVLSIDGNKVTLAGELLYQDAYQTNVRVSAYTGGQITIENGTVRGDQSNPEWTKDLVQVRSAIDAVVQNITVRDGNSMGINIVDSVHTLVKDSAAFNLTDDTPNGHYGYGIHSGSSLGTLVDGFYGDKVRHTTDNNAIGIAAGMTDPSKYGADIGMTVKNSVAYNNTSYAYDWHSEGRQGLVTDSLAFDSFGFLGARGMDNTMTNSAGANIQRGILVYEYGNGDGSNIHVDNVSLKELITFAYSFRNSVSGNSISNSVFEVIGSSSKAALGLLDLKNTTTKTGTLAGAETINGADADDKLLGGVGNDIISGGKGNDYVWGGKGVDTLTGGDGIDHFAFHSVPEAGDTITDFKTGVGGDVIDLAVLAIQNSWKGDPIANGYARFVKVGGDAVLQVNLDGKGDDWVTMATLKGVNPAALTVANLVVTLAPDAAHAADGTLLYTKPAEISKPANVAAPVETPQASEAELFATVDGYARITGSQIGDKLTGAAAADLLVGGEGNDRLDGGAGDDLLVGGTGADALIGGAGNDTATYAGATSAVTVSLAAPAANTGEAAGDTYGQVENLTGSIFDDILTGTDGVNILLGGAGADKLYGLNGSDVIKGEAGDDLVDGGDKSDTLYGGDGADVVYGGAATDTVFGDAGDDRLYGGEGVDALDGGTGADYMDGGAGNDTYTVDNIGDAVIELANGGSDQVLSSISYQLGANVEDLTLLGSAANGWGNALDNDLFGNAVANRLYGGDGIDKLDGGAGDDFLFGGAGKDVLTGGAGSDVFVFGAPSATSVDKVVDFQSGLDKIALVASDFGLTGTSLASADFLVGVKATGTDSQLFYNEAKATLFFDADGAGKGAAVAVATFTPGTDLHLSDFVLI